MKINEVITGKYAGCKIMHSNKQIFVSAHGLRYYELEEQLAILKEKLRNVGMQEQLRISNEIVAAKRNLAIAKQKPMNLVLNSNNVNSIESADKNSEIKATSAIARGTAGSFLLGPIGVLAAVGAKKKTSYILVIEWKDGNKSVISVDEKFYQILLAQK